MSKFKVTPHGFAMGPASFRPVMIFKDDSQTEVLPIVFDQIDANLLLARSQQGKVSDFQRGTLKVLQALGLRCESVYFDDVSKSVQYATVVVNQNGKTIQVKLTAAEAVSFCLHSGCTFFTNEETIKKSRELNFDWFLNLGSGNSPRAATEEVH